ncbi:hypothetical protein AX15_001385 [Amanita polypyramis BW_CC]|nr:hypothetical protein AX15_001385 [Amanita polypyramis BW_CC]
MKYADFDTNDGYWGDDDKTGDGHTSESDHPSSFSSSRSRTHLATDGTPTPPAINKGQNDFSSNTPSSSRSVLPPRSSKGRENAPMPSIFTGFSSSFESHERILPDTPQSRRSHIREAFKAIDRSSCSPSRRAKPTARTGSNDTFDDIDEEREVSMILTDSEHEHGSPTILPSSSAPFSLSLTSDDSFSSVNFGNHQITSNGSTRGLQRPQSPTKITGIPEVKSPSPTRRNGIFEIKMPSPTRTGVILGGTSVSPARDGTILEARTASPTKNYSIFDSTITSSSRSYTCPEIRMASPFSGPSNVSGVFHTLSKNTPQPQRSESSPNIQTLPGRSNDYANMALANELGHKKIAHDRDTQKRMDDLGLSWGVQYELARGVTMGLWTWSEVQAEKLEKLKGTNIEATYKVAHVMRNRPINNDRYLPLWAELDREQDAIIENKGRGLGLMGSWGGESKWYGGRIQQQARIYKDNNQICIKLEPMEMRRSHRFARYCGSRRILQVRIPDDIGDSEDVRKYLCQRFVLCGRVFVPFHAKEGSVYMVETNENFERRSRDDFGDQHRMPLAKFIEWHNPLYLNRSQAISKYSSRFALGLSNSVPAVEFQADCIHFINDEYPESWDKKQKAPSEKIMTDGCGFINRAAMMEITRRMKYGSRPTAVQGRIGGAKGLWIVVPGDDEDHLPRIWIRDSQTKIKYTNYDDRSHRILDLLSVSQPSPSISLSSQSIINLFNNGVPRGTLIELLEKSIKDEADPLMDWTKPTVCLWDAINRAGRVSTTRALRYAAGKGRALGLARREWGPDFLLNDEVLLEEAENEEADMNIDDDTTSGRYTGRNKYNGMPLSLPEYALELVQAGFKPAELGALRDKIRYLVQQVIESAVEKYRIPLQESISAYVVPDPSGTLEEGEIFYRSSQALKDPESQTMFYVLKGQVLIGRYPVRLECDVQKVTAVDKPELSEWSDVIIVSTKGERSPASILSGGDYDGDELFIIREACLVQPFKNKPFVPEPVNLQQECFDINAETVEEFQQRAVILSRSEAQVQFQHALLSGLNDSKMKLYSRFHEYAMFKYGHAHPDTIKMAYMFSIALDSAKTGLRVKPDVFKKHRSKFNFEIPLEANFILNHLMTAARKKGDDLLRTYDQRKARDVLKDLKQPWEKAREMAEHFERDRHDAVFREDLQAIVSHVGQVHKEWLSACQRNEEKTEKARQKKKQRRSHKAREDAMLNVTRIYKQGPNVAFLQNVDELKASYACQLSINFALAVAFNKVCEIKAKASSDGYAPSTRIFDELKNMGPSLLRAFMSKEEIEF